MAAASTPTESAAEQDCRERGVMFVPDDQAFSLDHLLVPTHYRPWVSHILIPHGLITDRVEKMADTIRRAYPRQTIHLVCVLKGGSAFFQDLVQRLRLFYRYNDFEGVPFTFDFVRVKSYHGTESTGNVQISGADISKWRGKHVLLVEDIIDTGTTMTNLLPVIREHEPASLRVASLLEKRTPNSCGFKADFVGFSIPDAFVVGNNLDLDDIYRDLAHICVINQAGIDHFSGLEMPPPPVPLAVIGAEVEAGAGAGAEA